MEPIITPPKAVIVKPVGMVSKPEPKKAIELPHTLILIPLVPPSSDDTISPLVRPRFEPSMNAGDDMSLVPVFIKGSFNVEDIHRLSEIIKSYNSDSELSGQLFVVHIQAYYCVPRSLSIPKVEEMSAMSRGQRAEEMVDY